MPQRCSRSDRLRPPGGVHGPVAYFAPKQNKRLGTVRSRSRSEPAPAARSLSRSFLTLSCRFRRDSCRFTCLIRLDAPPDGHRRE